MMAASPLRLLLWLKWTLIWRGYRRNRMKVLGAIILLVAFLPLSAGSAWVVWFFASQHPSLAPLIARDALAIIYGLWIITPLLGFQLNESYDLTKLFVYPLPYSRIFLGSVLGSLLDLPVVLTLPTFGVLLALFSSSALAFFLNLLLLLLFLLHTLALGQAITMALIGFLRSRRFRDITIVLFPLIGMTYYLGQRVFFQQLQFARLDQILDATAWRVFGLLPPGWTAAGLGAAQDGRGGTAVGAAALMAGIGALTLWAASSTLRRLYLGDVGPSVPMPAPAAPRRAAPPRLPSTERRAGRGLAASLPMDVRAVAGKEFVYFQREPQYKAMAVNIVYTLVAVAAPVLIPATAHGRRAGGLAALGDWLFFGLSGTLLLAMLPLLFNIFGGEGAAITVLFSFPTRRRALLLGKNLAHLCLLLGLNVVGLVVAAAASHGWAHVPQALALVVLAAPVLLAAGNLVSIRFPHRLLVRGQRWQKGGMAAAGGGDGAGCAFGLLYLLAYAATFAALLPCIAAVLFPSLHWLGGRFVDISPLWYALTLPLALAYSLTLYVLLLGQAELWLLAREPEIAAKIVPAD